MSTSPKASGIPTSPRTGDVVLIAMDGSEYSDYALHFYSETLHKPGNKVYIAHVTEYKVVSSPAVTVMTGDINMSMITQEIEKEEKETEILVEKLATKLDHLKLDAKIERTYGDPGAAICTVATNVGADYIVVGCRGKGKMRRTFTGSVTDYVTHHSHVPVLIARHKDHMKHHHHGFHFKNPLKH